MIAFEVAAVLCVSDGWAGAAAERVTKVVKGGLLGLAAFHFAEAIGETFFSSQRDLKFMAHRAAYAAVLGSIAEAMGKKASSGIGAVAIRATRMYSLMIIGLLVSSGMEP